MDYILELALDKFTDHKKFEEIATRILNDEGYLGIRGIGGIADDGADGEQIHIFTDSTERTIFQYSLDKKTKTKIIDTIEKLKTNQIDFQSLVYVTTNQINNIQALRKEIRTQYKNAFEVDIIDRKTIIARLTANSNSLFNTYFPNVRSQIDSTIFNKKVYFSEDSSDLLENSLLKCSLLFSFNQSAVSTRKDLFDKLVLSVIATMKTTSYKEIASIIKKHHAREFPEAQIRAAAERLERDGYLKVKGDEVNSTKKVTEDLEGNLINIEYATEALINDILEKFKILVTTKIDSATIGKVTHNIKSSLSAFFRLHGIDYISNQDDKTITSDFEKNNAIISITKEGLNEKYGTFLVYAIGETIRNPSDDQAEILSKWAKAFISIQVMNLDPTLREFQATSFKKKTFIIDTDFLLYCLVKECPLSQTYRKLVKELNEMGCTLIIPTNVMSEVLKHGEAESNYNYFSSTFQSVDVNIIEEKIHNVFVKGYYCGLQEGRISSTTSFKTYLSNYIDKELPYEYLEDLIEKDFPRVFEINDLASISNTTIQEELVEKLTLKILDITKGTFKAQWRSYEENYEISENDARMYLTTYFLNKAAKSDSNSILPGDYYLLTSSTRAARCSLQIGLKTTITVKPETLISLLEQLGSFEISSKEYINIFENPYLVNVSIECWENIKVLIDAGVDLKDKNPVRLQYDLKQTIHDFITNKSAHETEDYEMDQSEEKIALNEFEEFVKNIKKRGYSFTPSVEAILDKFKSLEENLSEKEQIIEELTKSTELFGKRKQHYLNKIASNPGKKNRKK